MNSIKKMNKRIDEREQEIERLNNIIKQYDKVSFIHEMELQKRIDKAIEYINNLSNEPNVFGHYGIDSRCKNWLLNILKGSDKE